MDRLRNHGQEEFFSEQEFDAFNPGGLISLLQAFPNAQKLDREKVPASKLHSTTLEANSGAKPRAISLIRIDRHPHGKLCIPRDIFLSIFNTLNLDPYTLRLLLHESYGPALFGSPNSPLKSYYIGTISFFLIYSHNHSTRQTRGIIIPRISDSIHTRDGIFESFATAMSTHLDFVAYHWFPRYLCIVETARWVDKTYENALHSLRRAERATGYGCWESWNPAPAVEGGMADFAEISKRAGFTAAALANVVRHVKIVVEMVKVMEKDFFGRCGELGEVEIALEEIKRGLAARAVDVEYVQERARTQLQVIFNLINQSEAMASREIARSTKEDSAAMKVIAVMTLFFLPGTFSATLFSIPSLYWSDDETGSPRFWVYWAITAPLTLALVGVYGFYRWRSKIVASMLWTERAGQKRD